MRIDVACSYLSGSFETSSKVSKKMLFDGIWSPVVCGNSAVNLPHATSFVL